MADKLTLVQEELLSEKVKLFPCLFDKADKGHKEKDIVSNAWQSLFFFDKYDVSKFFFVSFYLNFFKISPSPSSF